MTLSGTAARIYVTHCSAKKTEVFRTTGEQTTPEELYAATPLCRFISRCKSQTAPWAIFSDLYGVWFPEELHSWYEKDPRSVTPFEFAALLSDFDARLAGYAEICFYYNPGRFHPLYRHLVNQSSLKSGIHLFTHLREIARGP